MIVNRTIAVSPEHAGLRLDAFVLQQAPSSSRALVLAAIERRSIAVNGLRQKKGYRVKGGDRIAIDRLMESSDWKAVPNASLRIPILYEDATFLVIDKPAGMPVHPLEPEETGTVVSGLLAAYPDLAGVGSDPLFPAVVHRLDAETSGVMVVARNAKAYGILRRQFADRKVMKRYVGLVCGAIREAVRLEHYLRHAGGSAHRMKIADPSDPEAMRAITEVAVARSLPKHTLLDLIIRTGVTHQIRCQLAAIGHPLAGDTLYGRPGSDGEYRGRLFLHAAEIAFQHPASSEVVRFEAGLPDELRKCLAELARAT